MLLGGGATRRRVAKAVVPLRIQNHEIQDLPLSLPCCRAFAACCSWDASPARRRCQGHGPAYDRPFPLGQVTDAHWETQQTNAEASDFIFYDHEFVGNTAQAHSAG